MQPFSRKLRSQNWDKLAKSLPIPGTFRINSKDQLLQLTAVAEEPLPPPASAVPVPPRVPNLIRALNTSIEEHRFFTIAVFAVYDIVIMSFVMNLLVHYDVHVPADLLAAVLVNRVTRRIRFPADLAVAALVARAFPSLTHVKVSRLLYRRDPNNPKPLNRFAAMAINGFDRYGLALLITQRCITNVMMIGLAYCAFQTGNFDIITDDFATTLADMVTSGSETSGAPAIDAAVAPAPTSSTESSAAADAASTATTLAAEVDAKTPVDAQTPAAKVDEQLQAAIDDPPGLMRKILKTAMSMEEYAGRIGLASLLGSALFPVQMMGTASLPYIIGALWRRTPPSTPSEGSSQGGLPAVKAGAAAAATPAIGSTTPAVVPRAQPKVGEAPSAADSGAR